MLKDAAFNDPGLIRDTLVALLFAGRDNTQNAFAWSLYSLISAPHWVARMRVEANDNRKLGHEMEYGNLSVRQTKFIGAVYSSDCRATALPRSPSSVL